MGRLDKEVISEGVRCGIERCRAVFLFSRYLRRDAIVLRAFLDFFHHYCKDFVFRGDIDQTNRREIDIHLDMAVPIVLVIVMDFDTLDQQIYHGRCQFLYFGHFTERLDEPPCVNLFLFGFRQFLSALRNGDCQFLLFRLLLAHQLFVELVVDFFENVVFVGLGDQTVKF